MPSEKKQPPRMVKCPTCGQLVAWSDKSRWRPFCNERCWLIDLGEWLADDDRETDQQKGKQ